VPEGHQPLQLTTSVLHGVIFVQVTLCHSAYVECTDSVCVCYRPVLTCSDDPEAWDRGSVGAPCPVSMAGGSWRLYYSGRQGSSGAWTGIGMALTSSDSEEVEGIKISFKRRGKA